jgi:Protein of unknown function (DUF3082)
MLMAFAQAITFTRHVHTAKSRLCVSAPAWRCATTPGFRTRDADNEPKRSFSSRPPPSDIPLTPNQRVLAQVRKTMEELGVSEDEPKPPPAQNVKPVDLSRVNPFSALAGSFGAAVMAYAAWHVLVGTANFYANHPFDTDFYVVRRINAIVRTALVGIFALASGISGVTALGLFLLAGRTGMAAITGEFKHVKSADGLSESSTDGSAL